MESEGARFALIENASALADQVEPVRPTGVSRFDLIVDAVNQCRKLDAQLPHARASDKRSLQVILRTTEEHFVAHVGPHLPNISWMRLEDIDRVEADLVAILFGELIQGGNLPPKWRSGVTAKHQDNWPIRPE